MTLLFHQDLEFIKKEIDKSFKDGSIKPYDYYILSRFTKEEHEKYAKLFWEKIKDTDHSYYFVERMAEYDYSWLPKQEANEELIEVIE